MFQRVNALQFLKNVKKCGLCLASGCPAITKNEDGTISIDQTLCNGCGLCMQNCHFDAIELKKKGE